MNQKTVARHVAIGSLVRRVGTWNPARDAAGRTIDYVDLGSLDNETKQIKVYQTIAAADAPSRARQLIAAGDILVSTVRPNLNGVARVPDALDGSTASTGFCVLRPQDALDASYLFQWVKSPTFVKAMERRATGQSYPAVSDRIVLESEIPLPLLEEQRRIAAILDQTDGLRRKRLETLSKLREFSGASFTELFGDLVSNDRDWPKGCVGDLVAKFESGKSLVANDEEEIASLYRVLKISAVTSLRFRPEASKALPDDYEVPPHHLVRSGDLLFSRANTADLIGATAYVDTPCERLALPDKLWRFCWPEGSKSYPLFVWQLFMQRSFRDQIRRRATGTSGSMKNISQDKVLGIEIGLPDPELQRVFSERFEKARCLESQLRESSARLDDLFASLQSRAFSGEL